MNEGAIQLTKLSLLWTRTFFDFFQGKEAKKLPYGFFASISGYKAKFLELRSEGTDASGLSLPWGKSGNNWFWKFYLEGKQRHDLSPNQAWSSYLIPFRKHSKTKISSPNSGLAGLEGFFYPHGVVAIVTIELGECKSLKETVEKALQIRHDSSFAKENEKGKYTLNTLASEELDTLCSEALGKNMTKGMDFSGDPFSIVTIIKGAEDYSKEPIAQGNSIHKALETLATWNSIWPSGQPPKPEDRSFANVKHKAENHCLYSNRQGRVIWFPEMFAPKPPETRAQHKLSCYHRNLVVASMQTASLGAFLIHAANEHKKGINLPVPLQQSARNSIDILDRFSQGQNTYRTWSTHVQIEQNGFLDAVNYLKTVL